MLKAINSSVRRKLMVVVLVTTFTALLVAAIALVTYELRTYEKSWASDLTTQADILARASAPALSFDDARAARENLALLKVRPQILSAAIYSANGKLFATYVEAGVDAGFPPLPGLDGYRIEGDRIALFHRIVENGEILGTVYLQARYELAARLKDYLTILGGVLLLSLAVAFLMSAWLQAAVTKPITAITRVAHEVMERRDFSLRVQKTTADEIGYLVDTFNDMLAEVGRRAAAIESSNVSLQHEMAERRLAEEALRSADRRKDEFLATLAHELRNPLAPLRNALRILDVAGSDPGAARRARDMMERQLQQMVRLVDDLLDVSRITTGKLAVRKERTELSAILRNAIDTVRPFIEARRHTLATRTPPDPVWLDADETRLAQVFSNLLNNAAKYTDPGGRINLDVDAADAFVTIRIADNGIGIAPAMQQAIFDMFTQVDRSLERTQAGLGVGLTLAKRLIELHGGRIEARSEGLNRGSDLRRDPADGRGERAGARARRAARSRRRGLRSSHPRRRRQRRLRDELRAHPAHAGQRRAHRPRWRGRARARGAVRAAVLLPRHRPAEAQRLRPRAAPACSAGDARQHADRRDGVGSGEGPAARARIGLRSPHGEARRSGSHRGTAAHRAPRGVEDEPVVPNHCSGQRGSGVSRGSRRQASRSRTSRRRRAHRAAACGPRSAPPRAR